MPIRNNSKLFIITALMGFVIALPGLRADGAKTQKSAAHDREELMEMAGFATKTAAKMVEGKTPWDGKKAELAMRTLQAVGLAFGHKVPEGSITEDSEASPDIWKNMKDFQHQVSELESHSDKAAKAARKGLDAFKPEFTATVKYCKTCHKKYRIKKKS